MASDVSCFWWSECYFLSSSYLVVWDLSISHKLDIDTWDYFQCSVFKVPISFIYLSAVFDSCWSISNLFCFVNTFLKKIKLLTVNFRSQWRRRDSNSWPPACKAGALPTELRPRFNWRPPTLPCRLQHSTIGRSGLNHRVRDGNGCVPWAHRHPEGRYQVFTW